MEEAGGVGWKCCVGTAVAAILGIDSPNYTLQYTLYFTLYFTVDSVHIGHNGGLDGANGA